ncbi:MAG: peptide-methionine (R)-S-oxide reductase MsrB, partial [Nitrospirae bacterium]|nr:peptide-methionine (R)-S-oxide reductase MsrB [Nitrospirota bacterium]
LILSTLFFRKERGRSEAMELKIEKVHRSAEEWRAVLTAEQFHILRKAGTERPHSSSLLHIKERGVYACAGCDLPLFTSEMKYDSGTGWPSFYTSIEGRLETKTDFKLLYPRTEYHCVRCEGHQGHVFDDGPPTYKRFCNNGVALKFIPETVQ